MYLRSLFYKNTSNFCDLNWNLKYFLKNKISIFKGIISIIPVLLIALVVIIVTLARLLKCWKNSNRSNRSGNRSQQAVFTTDQFNAYDSAVLLRLKKIQMNQNLKKKCFRLTTMLLK